MKLYYATGTCSMSCVIAVEETGIPCDLIEVSWKKNLNVDELNRINPLGATPALVLDDGKVLTQNAAILEYFADLKPETHILDKSGTWERANVVSWVSFVASDFHKAFVPAFRVEDIVKSEAAQAEVTHYAQENIRGYLKHIESSLRENQYIAGTQFSIADCYLLVILNWCEWVDVKLDGYPKIVSYINKASDRPGVKRALARE